MANCGRAITLDSRYTPQAYCTVLIPGGVREGETLPDQCWFGRNMNIGDVVTGATYNTHTTAGIQKICYNNDTNNCDKYGGLYSWEETVYGENVTAQGMKYVSGNSGDIQGLCPDGWHVPSDAEFKVLERNLGMTRTATVQNMWRGTDQSIQMRVPGTFEGGNWCKGADCNKSGFNALPGGRRENTGGRWYSLGSQTFWWVSEVNANVRSLDSSMPQVYRYNGYDKSYGMSVRCINN